MRSPEKAACSLIRFPYTGAIVRHTGDLKAPADDGEAVTLIVVTPGAGQPAAGGRGSLCGRWSRSSVGRSRPVLIVIAKVVVIAIFKVLREYAV